MLTYDILPWFHTLTVFNRDNALLLPLHSDLKIFTLSLTNIHHTFFSGVFRWKLWNFVIIPVRHVRQACQVHKFSDYLSPDRAVPINQPPPAFRQESQLSNFSIMERLVVTTQQQQHCFQGGQRGSLVVECGPRLLIQASRLVERAATTTGW